MRKTTPAGWISVDRSAVPFYMSGPADRRLSASDLVDEFREVGAAEPRIEEEARVVPVLTDLGLVK